MHLVAVLSVSILLSTCGVLGKKMPLSEDQKKLAVDLHNKYRRGEHASNMNELVWCQNCADVAAEWIARCDFNHQKKLHGENLYYSTMVADLDSGIGEALSDWFKEKYLPGSNRYCGARCHYTQMVWAETREVGCAAERCSPLWAFGGLANNALYIACFYTPKGNTMGKPTYLTGTACSKCRDGQGCEDGLCTGKGTGAKEDTDCQDNKASCTMWASDGQCNANPRYMKKQCRKSCGLCSGKGTYVKGTKCEDNEASCKIWASHGQCYINPKYMKKECRKSCGVCSEIGGVPDVQNVCEDGDGRCKVWASHHQCTMNPGFMEKECRESCGVCSGSRSTVSCTDNNSKCAEWASIGECNVNPDWMLKNCKNSCGVC